MNAETQEWHIEDIEFVCSGISYCNWLNNVHWYNPLCEALFRKSLWSNPQRYAANHKAKMAINMQDSTDTHVPKSIQKLFTMKIGFKGVSKETRMLCRVPGVLLSGTTERV